MRDTAIHSPLPLVARAFGAQGEGEKLKLLRVLPLKWTRSRTCVLQPPARRCTIGAQIEGGGPDWGWPPLQSHAPPQNFGVYWVCWFGLPIRSQTCLVSEGSTFSIVLKMVKPFFSFTFARCTVCTTWWLCGSRAILP